MRKNPTLRSSELVMLLIFAIIVVVSPFLEKRDKEAEQKAAPMAVVTEPGKLIFDHAFHDFGEVTEGDVVRHTFGFKNEGPGAVKITKTETACGCTTASAALKAYAPGESGELEVTIDTRGKKGIVVKVVTVFMENALNETADLSLTMQLVTPPHPRVENVLSINTDPKCKTCHLDRAVGQKGVFLYHRICAQCHGKKGRGASASAFNDRIWTGAGDDDYIRHAIVSGIAEIGMPPYVEGVNPPLIGEQVDSLIEYIRKLEEKGQ